MVDLVDIDGIHCFIGRREFLQTPFLVGYAAFPLNYSNAVLDYLRRPNVEVTWFPGYGVPPLVTDMVGRVEFDVNAYNYLGIDHGHSYNREAGTTMNRELLEAELTRLVHGVEARRMKE